MRAASSPARHYKLTLEDVPVTSAKGETVPPANAQGAMDPNAQPKTDKHPDRARDNARRMHKP